MYEHGMRHREGVIARFFSLGGIALAVLGAAAAFLSVTPRTAAAACSNEAIRAEQGSASLALPECRAFELVSPGSTAFISEDNQLFAGVQGGKASPDGNSLSYVTRYPAQDSARSSQTYVSRRNAGGWSIISLDPQMTPEPSVNGRCGSAVALSEDLNSYVFAAGGELEDLAGPHTGECGKPAEELVAGEPRGYSNLYLRRGGAPFTLANPVPVGAMPGNATFQAASTDFSRIVFSESAELTPDSPSGYNLFEWSGGTVHLIGVLPNGQPTPAVLGAATEDWNEVGFGSGFGLAPVSHAVSADGERVFFEAGGNLYLRQNASQAPAANANCLINGEPGLACTRQVDLSFFGGGASGGGVFQFVSRNGDKVFFTSDHVLTGDSKALAGRPDLYEHDVPTEELTDLSAGAGIAANVLGFSGAADDGSRIYFVAKGALTGAAQAGQPNLYLAQHGQPLTFLATLGSTGWEVHDWWEPRQPDDSQNNLTSSWSPSGRFLLFSSSKPLTGFDNTPANPQECEGTCQELYVFDAETDALSCVSCDPLGGRPLGDTKLLERPEIERFSVGSQFAARYVSNDGQVFFNTKNPLSPRDVNGVQDVYEYRAGSLNLISSGTNPGGSAFVDASADSRDVFIITAQSLVRADTDGGLPSVYDARVEGGFSEPPPPEACRGEESCRPAGTAPPPLGPPATPGFMGSGNVKKKPPCKHGKVRRGGHCVKKKQAHHKKNKKSHHHAKAGAGKGGKS